MNVSLVCIKHCFSDNTHVRKRKYDGSWRLGCRLSGPRLPPCQQQVTAGTQVLTALCRSDHFQLFAVLSRGICSRVTRDNIRDDRELGLDKMGHHLTLLSFSPNGRMNGFALKSLIWITKSYVDNFCTREHKNNQQIKEEVFNAVFRDLPLVTAPTRVRNHK